MRKYKIIFLDVFNDADELLDDMFNENNVELCEIFTLDEERGIHISHLPDFDADCWDYLVIPVYDEDELIRDSIYKIMHGLKIPMEKVIFLDNSSLLVHADEGKKIFTGYLYYKLCYLQLITGKYISLTVEGLSFINRSTDDMIMFRMYVSGQIWAKDTMIRYKELAEKYYDFDGKQNIFCDLGANIGTTCIYFKKNLDRKIRILAFEPSSENYKLLRANMLLNDIDESEAVLINMGLSDKSEELMVHYDPHNPGGSSFLGASEGGEGNKAKLIAFDDYVEESAVDVSAIKYFWVDVEGFEPEFLGGARNTLINSNAPVVMEYSPHLYKKEGKYETYLELLSQVFKSYIIMQDEDEIIHDISELRDEADDLSDLFFLR